MNLEKLGDLFESIKLNYPKSQILSDMYLIKQRDIFNYIKVDSVNYHEIKELISEYDNFKSPTITCGIMTYNEERCIKRCLDSVINEFDEVIVLDSISEDKTVNIIKQYFPSVRLYFQPWINDFSFHRNKIIEHANSDWIYFIDADNYYSENSKGKAKRIAKLMDFLKIECIISPLICEHNGYITDDNRRMFPLGRNIAFSGIVHEEPLYDDGSLPINISVDILVHHDGYNDKFVDQYKKNQRNIELTKKMIEFEPRNPKWLYFYAKELYATTKAVTETKGILFQAIELYNTSAYYRYYAETVHMLCSILYRVGNFVELKKYIDLLEEVFPNCLDIDYYRGGLLFLDLRSKMEKILEHLKVRFKDQNKQSFSFINSSGDHLKYLMMKLAICLDDSENIFNIYKEIKTEEIKKELNNYFNNVIEKYEQLL